MKVTMNDAVNAGNGVLLREQAALLRACRAAGLESPRGADRRNADEPRGWKIVSG